MEQCFFNRSQSIMVSGIKVYIWLLLQAFLLAQSDGYARCTPNEECIRLGQCPRLFHFIKSYRYLGKVLDVLNSTTCEIGKHHTFLDKRIYVCCERPDKDQPRVTDCHSDEKCVRIKECQTLDKTDKSNKVTQSRYKIYKDRTCSINTRKVSLNQKRYVCCPQRVNLLPDHSNCGARPLVSRIFNGNALHPNDFPWMALLLYENKKGELDYKYRCGGSLINNRYVLTAAHCLTRPEVPSDLEIKRVRLGEHNITSNPDCFTFGDGKSQCAPKHLEIVVESFIVHPAYHETSQIEGDIALIRLKKLVPFSKEIRPICVPREPFELKNLHLEIAGWGETESGNGSEVLLHNTVKIANYTYCQKLYNDFFTESQICTGDSSKNDPCFGDSGGPLMATIGLSHQESMYVVGIVSYGNFTCGHHSAYTKTAAFFNWIQKNLKP